MYFRDKEAAYWAGLGDGESRATWWDKVAHFAGGFAVGAFVAFTAGLAFAVRVCI